MILSFNPKPEATEGVTCGQSIQLPTVASGFELNGTLRW